MRRFELFGTCLFLAACGSSTAAAPSTSDASLPSDASAEDVVSPDDAQDRAVMQVDAGSDASFAPVDAGGGVSICPGAATMPMQAGTCTATAGSDAKLITGTLLLPDGVLRGGQLLIDAQGTIACVGCDCSAQGAGATRIDCSTGVVSPGLINTHDHLSFSQNSPPASSTERYEQRHDWRLGLRGHTMSPSAGGASRAEIQFAEVRFLMGGATSTVGAGSASGFVRNLDPQFDSDREGLMPPNVDPNTFPLGDSAGPQLASGCAYPAIVTAASVAGDAAFFPHVSEGIDAVARNEFKCLSTTTDGAQDLLLPQSAFVHAVGLVASDYAEMAAHGTGLIWSLRSNLSLYGDTAIVTAAARVGVVISLSTDWILSGSMNLLRELRCADSYNKSYLDGFFSDRDLWKMVTSNAAKLVARSDQLGRLSKGAIGDVAIFNGRAHADYRAVIAAEPSDVVLVVRGGKVLYGDSAVVKGTPGTADCDAIDVCGTAKSLCVESEINTSYATLLSSITTMYPAFACGSPPNEPSCTPVRPLSVSGGTVYAGSATGLDSDGDGVPDAVDDCPKVFNPIRPVDNGIQADTDGDGLGDACDPCPVSGDAASCVAGDGGAL